MGRYHKPVEINTNENPRPGEAKALATVEAVVAEYLPQLTASGIWVEPIAIERFNEKAGYFSEISLRLTKDDRFLEAFVYVLYISGKLDPIPPDAGAGCREDLEEVLANLSQ